MNYKSIDSIITDIHKYNNTFPNDDIYPLILLLLASLIDFHFLDASRAVVPTIITDPSILNQSGYSWKMNIPNINAKTTSNILIIDAGPAGAN